MFKPTSQARPEPRALADWIADAPAVGVVDSPIAHVERWAQRYPELASVLALPQSADIHAEGPTVETHLDGMLRFLSLLVHDGVSLASILELRHTRGYEGEYADLEWAMREHVATLVFMLVASQLGKRHTLRFSARPGSQGARSGFPSASHVLLESDADLQASYLSLWEHWSTDQGSGLASHEAFFAHYGISIRYPGYEHQLVHPDVWPLVQALAQELRISEDELVRAKMAILVHGELGSRLASRHDAAAYQAIVHTFAEGKADEEPTMSLLQAFVFFVDVVGSARLGPHGIWHDFSLFEHLLSAQQAARPHRGVERDRERRREEDARWQTAFRDSGLDGHALMELLEVSSGPDFGAKLKQIHRYTRSGEGELPRLPESTRAMLLERIEHARTLCS